MVEFLFDAAVLIFQAICHIKVDESHELLFCMATSLIVISLVKNIAQFLLSKGKSSNSYVEISKFRFIVDPLIYFLAIIVFSAIHLLEPEIIVVWPLALKLMFFVSTIVLPIAHITLTYCKMLNLAIDDELLQNMQPKNSVRFDNVEKKIKII